MINEQTAWLGVPAICTVATGRITTPIPRGQATLVSFLPAAPWLFPYFAEAHTMSMSCDMIPGCKVLDSRGTPRGELTSQTGEGLITATVTLKEKTPQPGSPQPRSRLPRITYFISDFIIPRLMTSCYRQSRLNANSPGIQR